MSNQINVQPQQSLQITPRQSDIGISVSSAKIQNNTPKLISKEENLSVNVSSAKIQNNTPKLISKEENLNRSNNSQAYTKEQVKGLAKKLNEAIGPLSTFVQFGVDKHNVFYIAVIDKQTGKILSRFPAAQAPYLLQKIKEPIGIIFDTKG